MTSPHPDRLDRRRLLIAIATSTALGIAILVTVLSTENDGPGATAAGFEPVYENLDQRRQEAGVSTMGDPADADAHLHPTVELYAEGERIQIPVNIGIDPANPPGQMASLHTHETDGTIHMEGMSEATLGQFFEIWGVPFSSERLGPYEAGGGRSIRVWADGQPSEEFEQLKLADGQQVVVGYGTPEQLAEVKP